MTDRYRGRRRIVAAALLGALAATPGCTYLQNRGNDALDMFDIGFTFSARPQFGLYANCPFTFPIGAANIKGKYIGLGGGKFGVTNVRQQAYGFGVYGQEDIDWERPGDKDGEEGKNKSAGKYTVGPLGLASNEAGQPTYKPQCAHYLHLGFMGITGNLNYREWGDFFLGWFGADINKDDNRTASAAAKRGSKLDDLSSRLGRPRDGLQLLIRSEKQVYGPDHPIVVDVRLANRTGTTRDRRDKPRDLSVYYEPLADAPDGEPAEWLFKFYLFDARDERPRYTSPRFDVSLEDRARYYHYATLPPAAFVGRRFAFPAPSTLKWLPPGDYFFVVSYEVGDDCSQVILNPEFTPQHVEALGTAAAYARVWTGRLFSNVVVFRVESKRSFLGLF